MRLFFYLLSPFKLKIGYFFCDLISFIVFTLNTNIVKISRVNINIAYKQNSADENEILIRNSVKQSIRSYYETLYCLSRDQNSISKCIFKVENRFLSTQTTRDSGLILFSGHNRSIDMLLSHLANYEKITGIFKPIKIKAFDVFVKKSRKSSGSNVFETNFSGVKELFSALRENKTIAMAADQVPADKMGVFASFFGKDAYTTNLIPSLHLKTKSPIVSVAIHLDNETNNLYVRYSSKFLFIEDKEFDARSMNKEIEKIIDINPADYNWEYKRFKKNPEKNSNIYK